MIISCYTKRIYYNKKRLKNKILIRSGIVGMISKKKKVRSVLRNNLTKICNVRKKEYENKEEGGLKEK
ncbi:hypothetical protein BD408DRAFT_423954 [Parasitella parasitica]|nr:hypothetical protein BD408DRAFT_423954 [Parasitella parasitica]